MFAFGVTQAFFDESMERKGAVSAALEKAFANLE